MCFSHARSRTMEFSGCRHPCKEAAWVDDVSVPNKERSVPSAIGNWDKEWFTFWCIQSNSDYGVRRYGVLLRIDRELVELRSWERRPERKWRLKLRKLVIVKWSEKKEAKKHKPDKNVKAGTRWVNELE